MRTQNDPNAPLGDKALLGATLIAAATTLFLGFQTVFLK